MNEVELEILCRAGIDIELSILMERPDLPRWVIVERAESGGIRFLDSNDAYHIVEAKALALCQERGVL